MSNMQNIHSPDQYCYKGMIIKRCCNEKSFYKSYITIINPKKKFSDGKQAHCHASTNATAIKIINYYLNKDKCNYIPKGMSIDLRDKALCLDGIKVRKTH